MVINNKQRRKTIQRIKILEYLQSVKIHPTAEVVFRAIKKDLPTTTLATVYRNLNLLAEQGEILKFEVNSEFRFDADMSKHQHCVCKKCGKICDVFNKNISQYALDKVKTDYELDNVIIIFNGICGECK
jgi:Fe2+ or Zn2+ uptake regulation protein